MKLLLRLLLVSLLGSSLGFADDSKTDPYTAAVTSYIAAAGQQLGAIRAELEAETKGATDAVKQKYAGVFAGLDRTEKELDKLRAAKPEDFDRRKAEFESTRDKMLRMIEAVRRSAKSREG